ncbi:MAG: hypothetical protein AMXMBFR7_08870 [Planctomycetota bacterium]
MQRRLLLLAVWIFCGLPVLRAADPGAILAKAEPALVRVTFNVVMENGAKRPIVAAGTILNAEGLTAIGGDWLPRQMPDDRFADFKMQWVAEEDQPEIKAELVARDSDLHAALVKPAEALPEKLKLVPAALGDPAKLQRGDTVWGLGLLPPAYRSTLDFGSGQIVKRVTHPQELFVLTGDAAKTLFGPILNADGDVVGFVVQDPIFDRAQARPGGEARPASVFLPVTRLKELLEDPSKKRKKAWLGVADMQPLPKDVGLVLGLSEEQAKQGGVIVGRVLEGQPAAKAGLQADDIVVQLAGEAVEVRNDNDLRAFMERLSRLEVGQTVELAVLRQKEKHALKVELTERPKEESEAPRYEHKPFGLVLRELVYYDRLALDLETDSSGLLVHYVKSGSPPELGGLRKGDIILKVDDVELSGSGEETFKQFESLLAERKEKQKKEFVLFVSRGKKGQNSAFVKVETDWTQPAAE